MLCRFPSLGVFIRPGTICVVRTVFAPDTLFDRRLLCFPSPYSTCRKTLPAALSNWTEFEGIPRTETNKHINARNMALTSVTVTICCRSMVMYNITLLTCVGAWRSFGVAVIRVLHRNGRMCCMALYNVEVRHDGLHKYRMISGNDHYVVQQKAEAQLAQWNEMWEKKQKAVRTQKTCEEQTKEAQEILACIDNTLLYTVSVDDRVNWDSLKDKRAFPDPKPIAPERESLPTEPLESWPEFEPLLGFFDKISRKARAKKVAAVEQRFKLAHDDWKAEVDRIEANDKAALERYERSLEEWESERQAYEAKQAANNAAMDERRKLYEQKDPGAVVDYCDVVLANSEYPDFFPQEYELDYNSANGMVIVDYALPAPDVIPQVKEVKYVKSRDEFAEVMVSNAEANRRYDSLLYQICLRTVHELLEADTAGAVQQVVFNGWVRSIDPATGNEVNGCVLSLQVDKDSFFDIDLARVDPKVCFKSLKGVGSSKLHSLTPVAPMIAMDKNDRRFISSYEVADQLDEGYNLAAMDWEDFEHLIRELFEKEFTASGGEVKVTQASRDGGVDAIAFDPDPIRGGKIVIQAKRYTNTVSVSAVRDLYGAVINEGANKGILVTTSDYGPDAYEFTKGKPLTLLNGGNLLALLEKHGHKARIDLKEAKLLQADR